ncbi:MAG: hypothetical protein ABFD54_02520 [Armatimonadota bacterium]|nr:hypothetical protein [bacterium]
MKVAIYSLAGILIAGMAAGLGLSRRSPASVKHTAPVKQVVFVDISKLVKMHPSWDALCLMQSTSRNSQPGKGAVDIMGDGPAWTGASSAHAEKPGDVVSRACLAAVAAVAAEQAMIQLESQQRDALQARMRDKRDTLEQSTRADAKLREKEIEDEATANELAIAEKYCADRLNAQIKLMALQTVSGTTGIDDVAIAARLKQVKDDLDRITSACATQTSEAAAASRASAEKVWADAAERIDAAMSIYESGENRKIESGGYLARNDILSEVKHASSAAGTPVAVPVRQHRRSRGSMRLASNSSEATSVSGEWRDRCSTLQARIASDVAQAVKKIAREEGVRVTFSCKGSKTPDATERFARLMRDRAWRSCGPVVFGNDVSDGN